MALQIGINSYVSEADSDTYFSKRLGSDAWDTSTTKSQSLITASRQISLYVKDTCKLPFTPPLLNTKLGIAVQELALAFLKDASLVGTTGSSKEVKRAKAGSAEVEFFQGGGSASTKSRFPSLIMKLLRDAGCIESSGVISAISTGTDEDSSDCNDYGRTRGYY
jgi:hypothetical protein